MSTKTGIEWTDATWNPVRGCSRVSEGCRNCYAESVAYRFSGPGQPYEGLVRIGADGERRPEWNGSIRFVEEHLLDPLKWKKPRRIFVNSMSDLFHEGVTDEQLDRIFAVMALCPQHTFQVLTKRPERMLAYLNTGKNRLMMRWGFHAAQTIHRIADPDGRDADTATAASCEAECREPVFPLPNVWLGVSVEDQNAVHDRVRFLLRTPAAKRFVSVEPLLGRVTLEWCNRSASKAEWADPRVHDAVAWFSVNALDGKEGMIAKCGCSYHKPEATWPKLDWVIVGGESGPKARPMHPDWARELRDQCVAAGVPFFFKQWGEFASVSEVAGAGVHHAFPDGATVRRVGKKAAGDLLDGVRWHQFPEVRA